MQLQNLKPGEEFYLDGQKYIRLNIHPINNQVIEVLNCNTWKTFFRNIDTEVQIIETCSRKKPNSQRID